MDNVASPDFLVEFKERVLPMWNDVVSQNFDSQTRTWTVRFSGRPWNIDGYEGHRSVSVPIKSLVLCLLLGITELDV
jgi:hypothetical protein